ncbi:MAG: PQQ-binding-like beta-propeller repeat protein [Bryobacteraceae bacterium]
MPFVIAVALLASGWPQFRGPNGSGVSDARGLPVKFGPKQNVAWKTSVPPGSSSPILAGDNLFLTAHEGKERLVLCLDKRSGKIRWRRSIVAPREEGRHPENDAASPTPVTDGESVYAFFPDFGLISYDAAGKERWRAPLGPFDSVHGISASPVYAEGKIFLHIDQWLKNSYVAAFRARDGSLAWKTERAGLQVGGQATPGFYSPASRPLELVILASREMAGYSAETGEKLWWLGGLGSQPLSPASIRGDVVYANVLGSGDVKAEDFMTTLDANKDGKLVFGEVPKEMGARGFAIADANGDGAVTADEFERVAKVMRGAESALVAVRLGGRGELAPASVAWRLTKSLPTIPAPLLYQDVLYLVRDGGIATALDPKTGEVRKQGRLTGAVGTYYSSPVAGDGKVYAAELSGKVAVLKAGAKWEILAVNDLGEDTRATPALDEGRIFVRTRTALYAFSGAGGR